MQCLLLTRDTPAASRACGVSAEKLTMGDEVRDELEPVGGAIEDVCIGQGDENPAR
jgi:hypothetical protein